MQGPRRRRNPPELASSAGLGPAAGQPFPPISAPVRNLRPYPSPALGKGDLVDGDVLACAGTGQAGSTRGPSPQLAALRLRATVGASGRRPRAEPQLSRDLADPPPRSSPEAEVGGVSDSDRSGSVALEKRGAVESGCRVVGRRRVSCVFRRLGPSGGDTRWAVSGPLRRRGGGSRRAEGRARDPRSAAPGPGAFARSEAPHPSWPLVPFAPGHRRCLRRGESARASGEPLGRFGSGLKSRWFAVLPSPGLGVHRPGQRNPAGQFFPGQPPAAGVLWVLFVAPGARAPI